MSEPDVLRIVYDGECPFCTRFAALYRIRANVGAVELIDARERPDLVAGFTAKGLNINDGMVALWQDKTYYGSDSAVLLAMLAEEKGVFAALNRLLFTSPRLAGVVYPLLVRGRKATLRMMGRSLIETPQPTA